MDAISDVELASMNQWATTYQDDDSNSRYGFIEMVLLVFWSILVIIVIWLCYGYMTEKTPGEEDAECDDEDEEDETGEEAQNGEQENVEKEEKEN